MSTIFHIHQRKFVKTLPGLLAILFSLSLLVAPSVHAQAAPAGAGSGQATSTDPPLASFATLTGSLDYVAAGASMRNLGFGSITVGWTGSLVQAYLFWSMIASTPPPNTGTLNGFNISGNLLGSDVSPCWFTPNIYTFAAVVTPYVVRGVNSLTNFPSGLTSGTNPWGSPEVQPLDEGASLVLIFNPGGTTPIREINIYTGPLTASSFSETPPQTLAHTAAASPSAETTYVVADGQFPGNLAVFDGVTIDSNAFPGNDPKATSTSWSFGNLHDTKSYPVSITPGSTLDTAQISGVHGSGEDCLTWDAQVLRVDISTGVIPTTTSVSCNPAPVAVNQQTTCRAIIVGSVPPPPLGNVVFSISSFGSFSPTGATCKLPPFPLNFPVNSCSVSFVPSPGTEGASTVTATYGGDATHQGSSGTATLQVTKRTTSTSVSCASSKVVDSHTTTCTATVTDISPGAAITPTGLASWTCSPSSDCIASPFSPSNTCALPPTATGSTNSCSVTFMSGPGKPKTVTISAIYSGDTDHFGSSGSTTITASS